MDDYVIITFSVSVRSETWIFMDESLIRHGLYQDDYLR